MIDRINRNLDLAKPVLEWKGDQRAAARRLFSTLADLEKLAEMAVQNGGGVDGQLDDERVHRRTFEGIADKLGGREPVARAVKDLTSFILSLPPDLCLPILNVVAEVWLETVFTHVGRWNVAPDLFQLIAQEEARHSREAAPQVTGRGSPILAAALRKLEELLYEITTCPEFMYPLSWFAGIKRVSEMGRDLVASHKNALAELGFDDETTYLSALIRCQADADEDSEPVLVQPNAWERSARRVGFLGPIWALLDVPLSGEEVSEQGAEAIVVQAVAHALETKPRLSRTYSSVRGEIYQTQDSVVGVRREWDREGQIVTVYTRRAHQHDVEAVIRSLAQKTSQARRLPYPEVLHLPESILRIAPRPRCPAIVTNCMPFGIPIGMPALADLEGASFAVGIASQTLMKVQGKRAHVPHLRLSVAADHRVHGGRELGEICKSLTEYISGLTY